MGLKIYLKVDHSLYGRVYYSLLLKDYFPNGKIVEGGQILQNYMKEIRMYKIIYLQNRFFS